MDEPVVAQRDLAIEEVAKDGDVILVVGPEGRRMRVSSCVLRIASKVFAAMFGPNWRTQDR
jgi:hypothetical protein